MSQPSLRDEQSRRVRFERGVAGVGEWHVEAAQRHQAFLPEADACARGDEDLKLRRSGKPMFEQIAERAEVLRVIEYRESAQRSRVPGDEVDRVLQRRGLETEFACDPWRNLRNVGQIVERDPADRRLGAGR